MKDIGIKHVQQSIALRIMAVPAFIIIWAKVESY